VAGSPDPFASPPTAVWNDVGTRIVVVVVIIATEFVETIVRVDVEKSVITEV
jgi:hypothetical protein